MTAKEIVDLLTTAKKVVNYNDRHILGDLLNRADFGLDFVSGDNYYVWYFLIGELFNPKRIVEMGTRFGYSLRAMIVGSETPWDEIEIVSIDDQRDGDDKEPKFRAYFEPRVKSLNIIRKDTQTLTSSDIPMFADLCHVDAWHTTEGVYHECKLALASTRAGGVILVDDTNPGDVRRGAEMFCRDYNLDYGFIPTLRGMHIIPLPE